MASFGKRAVCAGQSAGGVNEATYECCQEKRYPRVQGRTELRVSNSVALCRLQLNDDVNTYPRRLPPQANPKPNILILPILSSIRLHELVRVSDISR